MLTSALIKLFGVFTQKQTFLNLAYLLAGSACALIDLILFSVSGALAYGLVAVPIWSITSLSLDLDATARAIVVSLAGLLVIPASVLLWFFPALLEQRLAAWLLNMTFSIHTFWTAGASLPVALARYILSGAAWRRFLFGILRIPLGLLSFLAVLISLPVAMALVSMPLVYLAGYQDLLIGSWRIDSLAESLVVFLVALLFTPLAFHILNLFSRLSGGLARLCLQD